MSEEEVYKICMGVDSFIAKELAESIVVGTSYDMLEAHYGIIPISRRHFYRKQRIAKGIIKAKTFCLQEERSGSM